MIMIIIKMKIAETIKIRTVAKIEKDTSSSIQRLQAKPL